MTDNTSNLVIKFKSTNTSHDILELQFIQDKTIQSYKQEIASIFDDEDYNIKLVHKGKVLKDKQKAGQAALKNATVMMVLTKNKKTQKTNLTSAQQTIPRTNLNTGLGSSSPIGFGGYGIMNHPQYMSAISSAVNQQKLQQMMDDPYYQGMIDQMLEDPQTLKQIMQQNPMTKQLMNQNPMMKMVMSNPAMMKMFFNKDTLKMAKQMQKNGGSNDLSGVGLMDGLNGFGGGLANSNINATSLNNTSNNNLPTNPFFPMGMMGSGFGGNLNQGLNFPNGQNFSSLFSNNNSTSVNSNPMSSLFENLKKQQQKANDELKYQSQIKQLNSMGFNDKQKCVKYLKQSEGDIDKALQKLCLDDDNKQSS